MALSRDQRLARVAARDGAWDGEFVFSASGRYHRPSCGVRRPQARRIRFFSGPEAARQAGLTPCRRCRPDRAAEASDRELRQATRLLEELREGPEGLTDPAALAGRLGMDAAGGAADRGSALAAFTARWFHRSPDELLDQERTAFARRRLLTTDAPLDAIGAAAGFASPETFEATFRRISGLTPAGYRQLRTETAFTLTLPRDLRLGDVLGFWGRDPESPTEAVEGDRIRRALLVEGAPILLEMELARAGSDGGTDEAPRARCRISGADGAPAAGLSPESRAAIHRIALGLLGLPVDPSTFEESILQRAAAGGDPAARAMAELVRRRPGLRIPQTPTVLEGLVWSVVGQQVTLGFAFTLRRRLIELAGIPVGDSGLVAHPDASALARLEPEELRPLQFSGRKAEYLIHAARASAAGELDLEALPGELAPVVSARLQGIRGIGPWSARYVMMRSCALMDCVPVGDAGLTAALEQTFDLPERPGPVETEALLLPYAPWRSLATTHLWGSLAFVG